MACAEINFTMIDILSRARVFPASVFSPFYHVEGTRHMAVGGKSGRDLFNPVFSPGETSCKSRARLFSPRGKLTDACSPRETSVSGSSLPRYPYLLVQTIDVPILHGGICVRRRSGVGGFSRWTSLVFQESRRRLPTVSRRRLYAIAKDVGLIPTLSREELA